MAQNKYTLKDFIYDIAYIAVLAGLILLAIGSFPELFGKLLPFLK